MSIFAQALKQQAERVPQGLNDDVEVADRLRNVTSEKGRRVLLRCDQAVDRSVFEPAMDAITRAGGIVVAVGDKSKRKKR